MTSKLQINVGGMHCSFCQESIRRAYKQTDGVQSVAVSVAHEEALIEYDAERIDESRVKDVLRDLGNTVRDPNPGARLRGAAGGAAAREAQAHV